MPVTMNHKSLTAEFKEFDRGGSFTAKISTTSVDRDGEVLVPQGMDASDYLKNPVVMWNHDYGMAPLGRCVDLRRMDHHVEADSEWAGKPGEHTGEWFPETVAHLVREGIIKGISVGFVPIPGGVRSATKGDVAKYGAGVDRVYGKWKLLEYSVVPIPANQDALITSVAKGLITPDECQKIFGKRVDPSPAERRRHRIVISVPEKRYKLKIPRPKPNVEKMVDMALAKRRGLIYYR